jgi:hypothetical protein
MFARTILGFAIQAWVLWGAGVDGKWNFVWSTPGGERRSVLTFTVTGTAVKADFPGAKAPLAGKVEGSKVTLSGKLFSPEAGEEGDFRLSGTVDVDSMSGEASWNEHQMTFKASRAE